MRQRRAKNIDERMQECSEYLVEEPTPLVWDECFKAGGDDLFVEIGCGKGQFIIKKSLDDPDGRYIAIEGQDGVLLRALEKVAALKGIEVINDKIDGLVDKIDIDKEAIPDNGFDNLRFVSTFVSEMNELFRENQLKGVYLNFSDPWPKARHAKRRLTYRERLLDYAWALKTGGFMEIKTDNDGLFEFTMEEIEYCIENHKELGFEISEFTRDLHKSEFESRKTMTEYETKFSSNGKNINYVKVIVNK